MAAEGSARQEWLEPQWQRCGIGEAKVKCQVTGPGEVQSRINKRGQEHAQLAAGP